MTTTGRRTTLRDVGVLVGLLVVAALLRLPNLTTRGTWDADQGHDMLVLRSLVRDGILPLLGPPTSIGDVHHGAWYYYLLSPAAALTGGESPLAVVALIALAGIAAVGVVWWLGRAVAGPVGGLAAGLVIAVSAAAIDESTFIWNPNLIALSSAIALATAWHAWSSGSRWWWIVAAIGVAVTMQCHVLGVALLPIVAALFVLDARRRPPMGVAVGAIVVLVVAFLPLVAHELTSDFGELRAALDFLAAGRDASEVALPVRFVVVGLRVVSWPLVGLITEGFVAAIVVTVTVIGIVAWAWRARSGSVFAATPDESLVARWFGLGLLWTTVFLTVAAPSLATVVPGLPNDHYHAFADPLVFVLVGIGAAMALARGVRTPPGVVAVVALTGLVVWNLGHLPPVAHADGGYPAAQAAAERVDETLTAAGSSRADPVLVRSLPDFKSSEAMAYPLAVLGRTFVAITPDGIAPGSATTAAPGSAEGLTPDDPSAFAGLVLLCDDRFAATIGAACGGAAEAAITPDDGGDAWGPLLDRFEAAPGRWVSVYGARPA